MDFALATGATSGMGRAIAETLLEDGSFVFLNYAHDTDRAERLCTELAAHRGRFEPCRADLSTYQGAESLISEMRERKVQLKYLVLCFGLTDRTHFADITVEAWERVMRANVNVPFFLIQGLHTAGILASGASILCVSSLMASIPHSTSLSYGVSKAAVSALCKNLVKFLAPSDIRINAIEPGFIDTPWQSQKSPEHRRRIEDKTALGRFGKASEVADMSLAILKNNYLTGSAIQISGGYSCVENVKLSEGTSQ